MSELYPLELSDVSTADQDVESQEDCTTPNPIDISAIDDRPHRDAAQRARQRLAEWTEIIHAPRRMSEIASAELTIEH